MPGKVTGRVLLIIALVAVILAATAVNCASRPAGGGTGTLTGTVSIGPLCPVEPCTVSRDRLLAAYAARPITVTDSTGAVVATVTADPQTGFSLALKPGTYTVDIPHQGIGGSRDLPATVTLESGRTVRLDIAIDTGIR